MNLFIWLFLFVLYGFAISSPMYWGISNINEECKVDNIGDYKYKIDAGFRLDEFARNLSNSDLLLIQDQYYYSDLRWNINSEFAVSIKLENSVSKQMINNIWELDLSDLELKSNYSKNNTKLEIIGYWNSKKGHYASFGLNNANSSINSSINFSLGLGLNLGSIKPFFLYSRELIDFYSSFYFQNQIGGNPFIYKNIFTKTKLSYGVLLKNIKGSEDINISIEKYSLASYRQFKELDIIDFGMALSIYKAMLPYTIKSFTNRLYYLQADINSNLDIFYLYGTGKSYSSFLRNFNINGKAKVATWELEKKLNKKIKVLGGMSYARVDIDSIPNIIFDPIKISVISDGSYRAKFWTKVKAHIAKTEIVYTYKKHQQINLKLDYLKIYPSYNLAYRKSSTFFGSAINDTLESEIENIDILVLNLNWNLKKERYSINIGINQIIPISISYFDKDTTTSSKSLDKRVEKDIIYGMGRFAIDFSYFL